MPVDCVRNEDSQLTSISFRPLFYCEDTLTLLLIIFVMSINPLNGGLQWLEYDAQGKPVGEKKEKTDSAAIGFNTRDINEYFQPQQCNLSVEERF